MYWTALTLVALSSLGYSRGQSAATPGDPTCALIARSISSSSAVFYPTDASGQPSASYVQGISHWAVTSTQQSKCVVEPGTAADVSKILRILGKTRTPFAVKGGGHQVNPGFSSTTGVHIAMTRFSEVTYDQKHQTATLGAGLLWDEVYAELAPHKVNALGGRATGIGVAGFILGGGYSWKVNQHGLTIDTVVAFELVKPDGTILQVTKDAHPDLFFGLKGGLNNFGIVTRFTLKVFPQTDVWGGIIIITQPNLDQVSAATVDFATNVKDPKASVITTYNFVFGQPSASLFLFYDAPNPPRGIFEKFLDIPSFVKDVETRDFLSLIQASPANQSAGRRGTFNAASLTAFTPNMLQVILKECTDLGTQLSGPNSTDLISYDVDPFLHNIFSHNDSPSAYPPNRNTVFFPVSLYYAWSDQGRDEVFRSAIHESAARIQAAAVAEGQNIDATSLYPNYAISDTPLQKMYGNNVLKLRVLKKLHDPGNVMGLAGGFKF